MNFTERMKFTLSRIFTSQRFPFYRPFTLGFRSFLTDGASLGRKFIRLQSPSGIRKRRRHPMYIHSFHIFAMLNFFSFEKVVFVLLLLFDFSLLFRIQVSICYSFIKVKIRIKNLILKMINLTYLLIFSLFLSIFS